MPLVHGPGLVAATLAMADATLEGNATNTLIKYVIGGGWIGGVIVLMSIVALALAIATGLQLRLSVLVPQDRVKKLRSLVASGDLATALKACKHPENDCYVFRIAGAALERATRGVFGGIDARHAAEEEGEAQTMRLFRLAEPLAVIAAIAPLLGLLGTVQGMIGAFETVATQAVGDTGYYERLAANISVALITTFQGLVVAIPCLVLHSWYRSKIENAANEVGAIVDGILSVTERASMSPEAGHA
ncbi:MAG: MotA/TolQ/ExbB proton channel family protein [Planctomycetota bacterium]|nr:MotA/TolQ/ExbB proton channel family protein [Planctomycetota bacterium]